MATRHTIVAAGLGTTAALLAAAGGVTWYYAGRITEPPSARPPTHRDDDRVETVTATAEYLTLRGPGAARPGWWGVCWADGYARVGPPASIAETVVRPIEFSTGEVVPGSLGELDAAAAPRDPAALPKLGAHAAEVVIDGPLGDLPCWWWPGDSTTWAILLHGRTGARHETFRLVPTMVAAGVPTVAASYRNDPDAPPSPDGRSHLGATEWEDVAAVVEWALGQGAEDVLLVGMSMGGACIGELLARSPLADHVRAVVLDAPVLDWGPVIRRAAVERGLPAPVLPLLLPPTMALAGHRSRVDWDGLAHLHEARDFDLPTLLYHGSEDTTVPVELADAFAAGRGDIVTYVRVEGADHLCSWNHARRLYEDALTGFLMTTGAAAAPVG